MYIITGAAGFIGSNIVAQLNDRGIKDIICVDRFRDGNKWLNLRGLQYFRFIHADDFLQPEVLDDLFEDGVTGVYHMGACSSTTERDVDFLMQNNVEYSQILFTYCTHFDVPICYASSAATYGAGENGYDDNEKEISKLMPLNAYGYSKQLMDEWVLAQTKTPVKWYGVKFFNVYGPNEEHKGSMRSVVSQAYKQIQDANKVKLFKSHHPDYTDGGQLRDFVYVKDVVRAMLDLMETDHAGKNGIYNLGTGKARSFKDLAEATFKALDKEINIQYIDMPEALQGQYQYFTEANMKKLKTALPTFEFHELEEGVKDYVQNYLATPIPYLNTRSNRG
ncbi:MAG: ADP-glyceromanno-heptose 6-epimerase [Halobacteriovoraceae bacterium]|nr:ADP-glyceromanno-heptose 6-epimerase [Halobacteriovoraceae bacterium]|tara:strand:- start:2300 stop:3304 length:1005 start_codon:yes stop_codon:yes gene_type:complete